MSGRYSVPATVTVRELCRAAGVPYAIAAGPECPVRLRDGGLSFSEERPGTTRPAFYVGVADMPCDDRAAALRILRILAVDLDCYEAGESLARARVVEPLRNGRYAAVG